MMNKVLEMNAHKHGIHASHRSTPAIRQRSQDRAKAYNKPTLGGRRAGMPWTEQEIAQIWDTSRTTGQIAIDIGRSRDAVFVARRRYATKAPKGYVHNGFKKGEVGGKRGLVI